MKETRST